MAPTSLHLHLHLHLVRAAVLGLGLCWGAIASAQSVGSAGCAANPEAPGSITNAVAAPADSTSTMSPSARARGRCKYQLYDSIPT